MLKIGIFLNSYTPENQIIKLLEFTNHECAGVWVESTNSTSDNSRFNYFKRIDDLIALSDIVIILTSDEYKFEIASKSIKKGVIPILNNINGLTSPILIQLQQLAIEMGIKIGFAELGCNFNNINLPLNFPFIAQINRSIDTKLSDEKTFQAFLTYDLATVLKISKLDIRKVRAYGLPLCTTIPSNLLVMVDFNNNSVFTYTAKTSDSETNLSLEVFTDNGIYDTNVESNGSEYEPALNAAHVNSIANCLRHITEKTDSLNSIDLAIETSRLVETVLSKINS